MIKCDLVIFSHDLDVLNLVNKSKYVLHYSILKLQQGVLCHSDIYSVESCPEDWLFSVKVNILVLSEHVFLLRGKTGLILTNNPSFLCVPNIWAYFGHISGYVSLSTVVSYILQCQSKFGFCNEVFALHHLGYIPRSMQNFVKAISSVLFARHLPLSTPLFRVPE